MKKFKWMHVRFAVACVAFDTFFLFAFIQQLHLKILVLVLGAFDGCFWPSTSGLPERGGLRARGAFTLDLSVNALSGTTAHCVHTSFHFF